MDLEAINTTSTAIILAVSCARDMFFDSEDDNEEDCKSNNSIENYCEVIVPNMSDNQFKMHFRLEPTTFEILLQMLHSLTDHTNKPGRPSISLEKEAMIMLWYLANMECFRSVADRFNVTKSTCWSALYRTCKLLLKVNRDKKIISWPTNELSLEIINKFHRRYHLPGVIGVIDGSHIPILAPRQHHNSYVNRKGYHSVLLQGVCDHNLCFIDVYAGQPGSIHDWTLFKKSDLYKRIKNQNILFPNNSHLLGDLAYPLGEHMLVGFKDYGNLTPRQKNFNLILSKTRVVIEHAFGLLKGRFRRLKSLETVRMDFIPLLIIASCILHNICIVSDDTLEGLLDIQAEMEEERRNNPYNLLDNREANQQQNNIGRIKRLTIMNELPMII